MITEPKPNPRLVRFSVPEALCGEELHDFIMGRLFELKGDDYYVLCWEHEEHTHPDYFNICATYRLVTPSGGGWRGCEDDILKDAFDEQG